ncbi:hypothetical protein HMPREF1246_0806 [Acidaminococcus sp. BV3L6]|nr:hypothetical protein HMPREF1246_0806 [Acidaminococcus sp. BV3L6]DAS26511.1 MAG TPA: hypothetical protein [Caudoviricetes sp.]
MDIPLAPLYSVKIERTNKIFMTKKGNDCEVQDVSLFGQRKRRS